MIRVAIVAAVAALSVGCVGLGVSFSPANGEASLTFKAKDCISDNVAGRTVQAIPKVGDWAMLHWGCPTDSLIGPADQ